MSFVLPKVGALVGSLLRSNNGRGQAIHAGEHWSARILIELAEWGEGDLEALIPLVGKTLNLLSADKLSDGVRLGFLARVDTSLCLMKLVIRKNEDQSDQARLELVELTQEKP